MHMRNFFALVALLLPVLSYAGTKLVETTATGVGRDDNEALADTLANAVAQVNGAQSSMSVNTGAAVLEGQSKTVKDGKVETQEASITARTTPSARLRASGSIASYEKVGDRKRDDGKIEVTVKAKVKQTFKDVYNYNAAGSSKGKRRVAVLQPNSDASAYDFFGATSSAEICDQLWTELESGTLQSGGVSVLDRKTLGDSLNELHLVGSNLTNEQEKAKLRQIRGADLIVMPTLRRAEHASTVQVDHMTGNASRSDFTLLDIEIRAVVPATGEILMDKHYVLHDAADRSSALQQIAGQAGWDIAAVAQGKAPRASSAAQPAMNAGMQPYNPQYGNPPADAPRAGVKLPGDP